MSKTTLTSTVSPGLAIPTYEPRLAHLRRYGSKRLIVVLVTMIVASIWAIYFAALGINPEAVLVPTAISVAVLMLVPSAAVYRIASASELHIVRFVARRAPHHLWLTLLFVAYAIGFGLMLGPQSLQRDDAFSIALVGWLAFGPLLRYVTRVLFAANLKGPTAYGALGVFLTISLPLTSSSVAVLLPWLAPWIGVLLIVFGFRCLTRVTWIAIARSVESIQAITSIPLRRARGRGIVKLVRQTEHSLNRSLIERGAIGYALCWVAFWCGAGLNKAYRKAFLGLRVQRFYSLRRYAKIVRATNDEATGSLLYLRAQSLIRVGDLGRAESLLLRALAESPNNPYLYLARAHMHLEQSGFFSDRYRRDVYKAFELATNLEVNDGLYICPDAIAEHAKISAFATAFGPTEAKSIEARRKEFEKELFDVGEARRVAEKHSVRLGSEIRGVEGIIQGLSGDFAEGYRAFIDSLSTGENLKARYYLAVLLMVGSASFLRPIYHLERILALAPRGSRLARLAQARLDEALQITRTNQALSPSWGVFRLLTFERRYLVLAESELPAWSALAYREDEKKRTLREKIFGEPAPDASSIPAWAPADWTWETLRPSSGDEANEQDKREVPIRNIS